MNTKVTTELQAEVISAKLALGETASFREVAEATGISTNTVTYILSDLPVLKRTLVSEREAGASLKARIVEALSVMPEFRTVNSLRRVLGMADTDHDIVHVLHSLHKEGKVDFREAKDGKKPVGIHLTRRGKVEIRAEAVAEAVGKATAEEDGLTVPMDDVFVSEPTPPFPFPLLAELIDREEKRKARDEKGLAYLQAAETLKGIDDDMARDLIAKAEVNDYPFPSPIEAEYLAYYRSIEVFPTLDEPVTVDDPKES